LPSQLQDGAHNRHDGIITSFKHDSDAAGSILASVSGEGVANMDEILRWYKYYQGDHPNTIEFSHHTAEFSKNHPLLHLPTGPF